MAQIDEVVFPDEAQIVLAEPRGFCAGVDRAITIVERALELHGAPIYVRHEIVHNRYVVDNLRDKGAVFVKELDEVPSGAIVVFSAHGVSPAVRDMADSLGLQVFDATCPLVTKVHKQVKKMHREGYEIIMIGHKGHPEVEGTLGQAEGRIHLVETPEDVQNLTVNSEDRLCFVTQTTLSVDDAAVVSDALKARFPNIVAPLSSDICYATQNRQDAVKVMATQCDLCFVVGSVNSSNSNRLREVAERLGCDAYLIDGPECINEAWLEGKKSIGITAGASAPEVLVKAVVTRLKELGAISVRRMDGVKEDVRFPLPKALKEVPVEGGSLVSTPAEAAAALGAGVGAGSSAGAAGKAGAGAQTATASGDKTGEKPAMSRTEALIAAAKAKAAAKRLTE